MSSCKNCGQKLNEGATQCANCGAMTGSQGGAVAAAANNNSSLPLILGISSIFGGSFFALLGVVLSVLGILFGSKNVDRGGSRVGLLISTIGLFYSIIAYLLYSTILDDIVFPMILAAASAA